MKKWVAVVAEAESFKRTLCNKCGLITALVKRRLWDCAPDPGPSGTWCLEVFDVFHVSRWLLWRWRYRDEQAGKSKAEFLKSFSQMQSKLRLAFMLFLEAGEEA